MSSSVTIEREKEREINMGSRGTNEGIFNSQSLYSAKY